MTTAAAVEGGRADLKRGAENIEVENVSNKAVEDKPAKGAKKQAPQKRQKSTLPNGMLLSAAVKRKHTIQDNQSIKPIC